MLRNLIKILPNFVYQNLKKQKEIFELGRIHKLNCEISFLKNTKQKELDDIFLSSSIESEWIKESKEIDVLKITDRAHGVNYGDRRALYYLIKHFHPNSVLEVGTHIGASTVYIALALKKNGTNRKKLISLDIYDVNNLNTKIYLDLGVTHSPIEMMRKINCDSFVEFITCPSLEYMQKCNLKFDFIFLDGDHSAKTVYREIGHASKLLNKNGTILLHDYFPNLKPLWSNRKVLFGPYMAIHRLIQEGLSISVIPLGFLPWSTKMNSKSTSLALLSKNE
jgi:predicted O-methyltransferase YrrM